MVDSLIFDRLAIGEKIELASTYNGEKIKLQII